MRKPWHRANPALFDQVKSAVQSEYPNLHVYVEGDVVFIRGSFPFVQERRILDRYLIEIEFPRDYPESVPIVRETEGRIPRTLDFHMMDNTDKVCLFLPDEQWWAFPPGSTFQYFLNGPVRNYFLGQTLVRMGEPWPFGQRAHGIHGILEFYTEILGTSDLAVIVKYLEYLSKEGRIKGHWYCPCGSGKRLRHCHFHQLSDLRLKIPSYIARRSWERLTRKISDDSQSAGTAEVAAVKV